MGQLYIYTCVMCAQLLPLSRLFAILWTVACQSPLFTGFSMARTLEWVAMSSSRGSPRPRDWSHVSCLAGWFFTVEPLRKPIYIYICLLFFGFFPIEVITEYWVEFPELSCRSLLVTSSVYSSGHVSIPVSIYAPRTPRNHKFSTSVALYLLCRWLHLSLIPHKNDVIW